MLCVNRPLTCLQLYLVTLSTELSGLTKGRIAKSFAFEKVDYIMLNDTAKLSRLYTTSHYIQKSLHFDNHCIYKGKSKGKGHAHNRPQGPKGVPGRLRPRIFLTFGTTRVVGRQPHAPAAFTPRGIPWYSFLEAESTLGHMVPSVATEKNTQCDTTGNRSRDRPTSSAVPKPLR
jgi:hypothetical protein